MQVASCAGVLCRVHLCCIRCLSLRSKEQHCRLIIYKGVIRLMEWPVCLQHEAPMLTEQAAQLKNKLCGRTRKGQSPHFSSLGWYF
eukprot:364759-Chlamydomonas_euryale.AAC.8